MIISLGLMKTGTRSLHAACKLLGLRSLSSVRAGTEISKAVREGTVPEISNQYDALFELAVADYRHFHRLWPDAKFLLSFRPLDEWIQSRIIHYLHRQIVRGHKREIDTAAWRREYQNHYAGVREFFAGRDNLLEINVCGGEGWEKLCPFLGFPIPDTPFPHENTGRKKLLELAKVWKTTNHTNLHESNPFV